MTIRLSDPGSSIAGLVLAAAMTLGTFASAQDATTAPVAAAKSLSEADVRLQLNSRGYIDIKNLSLADGTWNADVAKADGNLVKVHIDAQSGNAYAEGSSRRLNVTEVENALASAGYTKVRDLKMTGNFWQATADGADGKAASVRIDPTTGKVFMADAQ